MRRVRATVAATLLILAATAGPAAAAPVLVLHGKRVTVRQEPIPPDQMQTPTQTQRAAHSASASASASRSRKPPPGRYTRAALDALLASGAITQAAHDAATGSLNSALRAYRAKSGTRHNELAAVIANADAMSKAGQLTPSRLGAVSATLAANAQWWSTGPLLSSGRRVSIGSSELIWQYYPGQGIELQMLANWGKANGYYQSGSDGRLRALINELVPLAADRGGWPAWEYYFKFGGGSPPWTSSISQGTAIQALARASQRLADPSLADLGRRALTAFQQPPPNGVRLDQPGGPFYLIYSFAPGQLVLNAHLQALIGLYDFWHATGDPTAQALFQQGDAEAHAVLPGYDTGKWSLYDGKTESDLSYHDLVITFLQNLCKRTGASDYCAMADRFKQYEQEPPAVTPSTRRIRTGRPARLFFSLDKISRVGVVVSRGGRTVFSTSAVVGRGSRYINWSQPAGPGVYDFRVRATDLAGNQSDPADTQLRILKK